MGLDVVGYKSVNVVEAREFCGVDHLGSEMWEACDVHGWIIPEVDTFPEHGEGINDVPYSHDGVTHFRAGSYGSYNQWRNKLAVLAGYDSAEDVWERDPMPYGDPFVPLINFSDCEGTIGPQFCAQLLKDFEEYHEDAKELDDEHFLRVYEDFLEALRFVGPNGILCFC